MSVGWQLATSLWVPPVGEILRLYWVPLPQLTPKYPSGGGDGRARRRRRRRRRRGGGEVAVVGGGERGTSGDRGRVVQAGQGRRGGGDAVQGVRHRLPLRRRRRHRRRRRSARRGRRIGGGHEGHRRQHPEVDGSSSSPSGR